MLQNMHSCCIELLYCLIDLVYILVVGSARRADCKDESILNVKEQEYRCNVAAARKT
jgi:hypothetical protein